jgi:hypothetical protein
MRSITFRLSVLVVVACSLLSVELAGQQIVQPKTGTSAANIRQIQQQYQQLVKDLYTEEAEIQQKRATYGVNLIQDIQDTTDSWIGILKNMPPFEDPGESPLHYVEFLVTTRNLVNEAFEVLNGIVDSNTSVTEKELQLQTLNQALKTATARLETLTQVPSAAGQSSGKLRKLSNSNKDWTALDEAIEQMRNEDLPISVPSPKVCAGQGNMCRASCDAIVSLQDANVCLAECNIAEDQCAGRPVSQQQLNWVARARGLHLCQIQVKAQQDGCGNVDPDIRNPAFQAWTICMQAADSSYTACVESLSR